MDTVTPSPERLPGPESIHAPESAERGAESIIERAAERASRLDKFKESQGQATSAGDDDQQRALQAAKSSRKEGKIVEVMGKEVDLNIVTGHFFTSSARRVLAVVRRDIQKAADWLAGLRTAWQMWEDGSRNGKRLPVVAFLIIAFWKA